MHTSSSIQIPPPWNEIRAERISGSIMVIGAPDTGKSTFVRWLIDRLCRHHKRIGWIDGDPGQSNLGVPGTMTLAIVERSLSRIQRPEATFFVGATSPRRHMLPVVVGLFQLKERALAAHATAVVVDTTGLVAEEAGGGSLKRWKIELLSPDFLIALQRERELDHLLTPLGRDKRHMLYVLPSAGAVRPRTRQERELYRRSLFRRYFAFAGKHEIQCSDLIVYEPDKMVQHALIGLQASDGCLLALGVVLSKQADPLRVLTPLTDFTRVVSIRCGSLRLDPVTWLELY